MRWPSYLPQSLPVTATDLSAPPQSTYDSTNPLEPPCSHDPYLPTTGIIFDNPFLSTPKSDLNQPETPQTLPNPAKTLQPTAQRSSSDALILSLRAQGLTFRQIQAHGGFGIAESTLRGRYRALTKCKEERVREPRWMKGDISLLLAAHAQEVALHGANLRWSRVAARMVPPQASRRFAAQTCSKKFKELGENMGACGGRNYADQ
ncbi:hypothetical protein EJ05DRAFT_477571 [Pseudovirgaria hyperparasitica]|uniref:Myb-like domain-containing protein n=1 Tax=Pseudovirgaria hyperparasitica TaxID=470096 RepID=A0A6A6W360_9PEZI|nr:uncharacterized protein EJ05DRAFT_477571 [Pseudovirgaria hyperparasitica]KAF2756416.1 hypothetical protein EJ05DRAFT_477571 [Pseudovirgaria hyperparasitica]